MMHPQKKILLLGGAHGQLPAIHEAKNRGYYTVLCDYLADNPGRKLVDKFYSVSTTDHQKVLEIAQTEKIDTIFAFATDPASLTVAYVSGKLNTPGNSYESVELLSRKDLFRKMQKSNGFNRPAFEIFTKDELDEIFNMNLRLPVVVKPVDSSDTKGVFKVEEKNELVKKAKQALIHSRCETIITEEFIDGSLGDLHGDAFFSGGKMIFSMMGDRVFSSCSNPLKPSTELYPSKLPAELIRLVEKEVSEQVVKSGYRNGPVNIEVKIDCTGKIFVMEIGPRSGGTLTPQAICYSTGFDMLKASLDLLSGEPVIMNKKNIEPVICYALHSNIEGTFKEFRLNPELRKYVAEQHIYINPGENVIPYSEPGSTIGVLLFLFPNMNEVNRVLPELYQKVQSSIVLT
jgi:biotin carboxylase